jgi:hypothetical protein
MYKEWGNKMGVHYIRWMGSNMGTVSDYVRWCNKDKQTVANLINLRGIGVEDKNLKGMQLSHAELSQTLLLVTDLRGSTFYRANLDDAVMDGVVLDGSDLRETRIRDASLRNASLKNVDLSGALLGRSDISGVDLSGSNLSDVWFLGANLSGANLLDANLTRTSFADANLTDAKLPSKLELLSRLDITPDDEGYIEGYKTFGQTYPPNPNWMIKEKGIITEDCLSDIRQNCGAGINLAAWDWDGFDTRLDIWSLRTHIDDVVVPLGTDGKFRTRKAQLIRVERQGRLL